MSSTGSVSFPPEAFSGLAQMEGRHWWFRARNRMLLWILREKMPNFKTFLEVGCGTGYVLEGVSRSFPEATLFGSEFYEQGIEHAKHRVPSATFSQLDILKMDDLAVYDVIGAFDVVEHIEDDRSALKNIERALKPGGFLLLTVPQH